MIPSVSLSRRISYALVIVGLFVIVRCNLGAALVAGLFSYMLVDQAEKGLRQAGVKPIVARWSAIGIFVVVAALLIFIFISFIQIGLSRLPVLLDRLLPRIDAISSRLGLDLPIENVQELRALLMENVKENARSLTTTSRLLTRGFFQVIVAIGAALLAFQWDPAPPSLRETPDETFLRECTDRFKLVAASFERVMGAQVLIAAINTAITAVFLFGAHLPFRTMLTLATFICGMIPIAGNIISNSLIVAAALTVSEQMAVTALIFLVIIHKAEYFLNSRIVGSAISTPMWITLIGLIVGEALMGVTGVILAPALVYYFREELKIIPSPRAS